MKLDLLPEECIVHVLSCLSPRDACQASLISLEIRDFAKSDVLWEKFLPPDYREIMSRLVFLWHLHPKKSCFSSSRVLFSLMGVIRFPEVAELKMVCWLEIYGKINTRMLSPNTVYVACLIVKIADRAYGLDSLPSEVSVEVGDYRSRGLIYLRKNNCCKRSLESNLIPSGIEALRTSVSVGEEQVHCEREDGWLEIELGEFYNDGSEREVKMSLKEVEVSI
ncbi:unnamed protein product [Ilex paraguariensis]|uniref:F-box domain-containing protein n=1 Tax=Ilex paraguariensis TaxID=185542 RepID=A0ABC8UV15_9AQUA